MRIVLAALVAVSALIARSDAVPAWADRYDLKPTLKVPAIVDNMESKGMRVYKTQRLRGTLVAYYYDEGRDPYLAVVGLYNKDYKIRGKCVTDVKSAIHRYGFCLLGLNITDEWYRGNRDITSTTARFVGGHAVLCVGYDQEGVWILNSWGSKWGQGGFAHIGWNAFNRQFMYGAFSEGVYRDMV